MNALCEAADPVTVVVIDDNPEHLNLIALAIERARRERELPPWNVCRFLDPAEALAQMPANGAVAVVCDYHMPGGTGLDWLRDLRGMGIGPVLMVAGHGDEEIAAASFREGAADYLVKSHIMEEPDSLYCAIQEALRRNRLERCNRELARDLKTANTTLEHQNTRLEELTETAHRFVDNVAHEFRTPLTVIKEFAAILLDGIGGEVSDQQSQYLHHIIGASRDLAGMVDDFLDSSKLKAGALRVNRTRHAVSEIIEGIRPTLEHRAASKQIRIIDELEGEDCEVFADLEKAGRTLLNLAVNAIKFSSAGDEVRIVATCSSEGALISVFDHGPGLPADEVEIIFERFRQVGDVQRTCAKGFGLGLNIAKELAWLNLGTITVQSEVNRGSRFSLSLPSCDPSVIFGRYLSVIVPPHNHNPISLLQAVAPTFPAEMERVRQFLCAHCHPTDLVLPAIDEESIVLVGMTSEPDKWMARLIAAAQSARESCPDRTVRPFELRWVGTWSYPTDRETIFSSALGRTMGFNCCA